jgi:hypothetical protein
LEIAKSLDDTEYQLRALRGLWAHRMNGGEYRAALVLAYEFSDLTATKGDPADLGVADRMAAIILHYLGDQTNARRYLERRPARPLARARHSHTVRFLLDERVTVRALLSRILWLQGFPDQAAHTARLAVDDAGAMRHALSLCHALAQAACPVALYTGDLAAAQSFVAVMLDQSKQLCLAGWIARGRCFQGAMMIFRGDFAAGLPLLREALDELGGGGPVSGYLQFLGVLARGLGRAGQVTEGLAAIDQALALSERYEERWSLPELLRTKGELRLLEGSGDAVLAAENYFRQALDWACRDATLSWELRAAFSFGRIWRDQERRVEARDLVASVYGRFTEGFGTADLQIAKRLLDELG